MECSYDAYPESSEQQGIDKAGARCGSPKPQNKKGKWTLEEEMTLAICHRCMGNRWAAISAHFPGRSDNDVKNYWNSTLRAKSVARKQSFLWIYATKVTPVADSASARNQAFMEAEAMVSGFTNVLGLTKGCSEESQIASTQGAEEAGCEGIMLLAEECEAAFLKERATTVLEDNHVGDIESQLTNAISAFLLEQHILSPSGTERAGSTEPPISWSPQEELALAISHCEMGSNWDEVSAHLPGRTASCTKEFWYSTLKSRSPARMLTFLWIYATKAEPVHIYATRRHYAYKESKALFLSVCDRLKGTGLPLGQATLPAQPASAELLSQHSATLFTPLPVPASTPTSIDTLRLASLPLRPQFFQTGLKDYLDRLTRSSSLDSQQLLVAAQGSSGSSQSRMLKRMHSEVSASDSAFQAYDPGNPSSCHEERSSLSKSKLPSVRSEGNFMLPPLSLGSSSSLGLGLGSGCILHRGAPNTAGASGSSGTRAPSRLSNEAKPDHSAGVLNASDIDAEAYSQAATISLFKKLVTFAYL